MWNPVLCVATVLLYSFIVSAQDANEGCVCVPFYLCRKNGTIITDGEDLIDERIGELCPTCNCTTLGDVCCTLGDSITLKHPIRTNNKACGYRSPDGVGFKVGAESSEVAFGEFPWMIGIFENGNYRCGGSLIHPSVVLTAAHCVKNSASTYTIRAGEWDSSNTNEILKHQDRGVASFKVHEDFKPKIYYNDVALLFLDTPVELKAHINVACLVPSDLVVTNRRCYATGWGRTRFGEQGNNTVLLKRVNLPIVDRSTCQENLRKTRLGEYFNLHETFVCAGGEKDQDTCIGDGGGPLVCPIAGEEERYHQVGIVAWGIGCNDENVPGVYANIAALRKWIDQQMAEKNLEIKQYEASTASELTSK